MWKTQEGSTGRLIELCGGYFIFYIITGLSVKYFLSSAPGYPGLNGIEYLVYSTASSTLLATSVALLLRWYRMQSIRLVSLGKMRIPYEIFYIIPSGICTAIIIPATTLLYSFRGISVMVAMVIMRGAVIIIGRAVDAIQIRQGILRKKVYKEENIAVVFAVLAVSTKVLSGNSGGQNPFTSLPVMIIFGSYIVAYALRIYIMNFYKNTRPKNVKTNNNKAFFAIEQFTSTITIWLVAAVLFWIIRARGIEGNIATPFANAILHPVEGYWYKAMFWGLAFGVVAFFSVFLFMFRGRTATFAGLVNRLTSLIAGTTSTLIFAIFFSGKFPKMIDWISLLFILIAIGFMSIAERKRVKELKTEKTQN